MVCGQPSRLPKQFLGVQLAAVAENAKPASDCGLTVSIMFWGQTVSLTACSCVGLSPGRPADTLKSRLIIITAH